MTNRNPYPVTISEVVRKPFGTTEAVFGLATFADGPLRFRYRAARPGHEERCDLFTVAYGTGLTSPPRQASAMEAARAWLDKNGEPFAKMLAALKLAESFMAGFEDDPMQEGINDRLATIRAAITAAEG